MFMHLMPSFQGQSGRAEWTHEGNASDQFSNLPRPKKCIIFLDNIGTTSSLWFRIQHEKAKIFTSEKGR